MAEKILVAVAWPYANGSIHQGQLVGAYLPADIFARYHRAKGSRVLMVSGSDQHGTPITVRAEEEGRKPAEVVAQFHREFLETWERMGISFDLFTTTGTENHAQVTHDIFLRLLESGYIYKDSMALPYCPKDARFLLDRYVEGTCPFCGSTEARGDQCDDCGKVLDPADLKDARCKFCGTTPEIRESEHFFLKLTALSGPLREWVSRQSHWRKHVLNFTLGLLNEGMRDRAITRDIEWGISVPVAGFESKRIYVWFEAVIGYLSASKEWAQRQGEPEAWRDFWLADDCRSYYFIGKDNIPFHTIIWPGMLSGYGDANGHGLNLPYDVPANQYNLVSGVKASTSRHWAIWLPDYLSRYDPDPLRYYLSANMPEAADSDFTWAEFVRRNNDELVATWGNLAHRVLTFTYRRYQGRVPEPGELDAGSRALLERAETALGEVGESIGLCRFRAGMGAAMALAGDANRYLDEKAPWRTFNEDPKEAARALYTAIGVINTLKVALYPYLPFTSERLHGYLGYEGSIESGGWRSLAPKPGQPLSEPQALFKKLDTSIIEEEEARLGK